MSVNSGESPEISTPSQTGVNRANHSLFSSPPDEFFATHAWDINLRHRSNPARTGRILVDADRGNVVRCEEEAAGFPENFVKDRGAVAQSWDYVKIGDATCLLPVSARRDGSAGRVLLEYKNHRHFESATSVTFGKEQ